MTYRLLTTIHYPNPNSSVPDRSIQDFSTYSKARKQFNSYKNHLKTDRKWVVSLYEKHADGSGVKIDEATNRI